MKTAVIYWSGTGNTEAMAKAVAEGAGAECFAVSEFSGNVEDYDAIALGCPAMGAEELEESEFEPFFAGIEGKLSGKKIALFGSYGWGDGEWMRSWEATAKSYGALLACDSVICADAPDAAAKSACEALGLAHGHILAMQGPFSQKLNEAILEQYAIAWLVTKDGGAPGGYAEKAAAARAVGARLLLVRRPADEGLRMEEILQRLEEMFA